MLLINSVNLKNICFIILLYADFTFSVTVDYNTCERVQFATIYPITLIPKMRFYLFTKLNPNEGQELIYQDVTSVQISNFNSSWPTRIFVSGWKTTVNNCKTAFLKDGYLLIGNFNFIVVDWFEFNKNEYPIAVANVLKCGKLLGDFTKFLNFKFSVPFGEMYIIGHSLGAHVAGAAGKSIKPYQVDSMFFLDPSSLAGLDALNVIRASPDDAAYVEAHRTDMCFQGDCLPDPIGHATFYPNNGKRIQPPCPQNINITNLSELSCSHGIAVDYFRHSITSARQYCGIPTTYENVTLLHIPNGSGCLVLMGGEPSKKRTGHFYVAISASEPQPA